MRRFQREIALCIGALLVALLAIWLYAGTLTPQMADKVDLYHLTAPRPDALLSITRPGLFKSSLLSHADFSRALSQHLPTLYLNILQTVTELPSLLFSFHPQGIVMYAQSDGQLGRQMEQQLLRHLPGGYRPQHTSKYGITFTYYPEMENRFFGFYQHEGAFVASFSKKLLEQVARQQLTWSVSLPEEVEVLRKTADQQAPFQLFLPANSLNLRVETDSLTWHLADQWLQTTLLPGEGCTCFSSSLPYSPTLDSLQAPVADTLSLRIEALFPHLILSTEVKMEGDRLYFTGCTTPSGHATATNVDQ